MAHDALLAGTADVIVAGGMESMSGAPYVMAKHRGGARIGHDVISDSMYLDGLEDAYTPGKLMGAFAEDTAQSYQFTREQQDAFAIRSLTRAQQAAQTSGAFDREITPVEVATRKGVEVVAKDEQPLKGDPAKIPTLKAAFAKDGTITAANASSISDGAAALVMTRRSVADKLGLPVVAEVVAHAAHAHEPGLFTTAPVPAMRKALKKAGWSVDDVGPVRGQRGLCGGSHDRPAGARHPRRQAQRQRRRLRPRPSHWRIGRADPGDAALGAGGAGRQEGAPPASASVAVRLWPWRWSWCDPGNCPPRRLPADLLGVPEAVWSRRL